MKDKEFLKSCNLMDYSLLIIFFKKKDSEEKLMSFGSLERKQTICVKKGVDGSEFHIKESDSNLIRISH